MEASDDRLPCMNCGAPTRYTYSPDHEGLCLNCTPPPMSDSQPDGVPTIACTDCGTLIPDAGALQLLMPFVPRQCPPCGWRRQLRRFQAAGLLAIDSETPAPRPAGRLRGASGRHVDFNMYGPADRYHRFEK